jgi:hypothetical protein
VKERTPNASIELRGREINSDVIEVVGAKEVIIKNTVRQAQLNTERHRCAAWYNDEIGC